MITEKELSVTILPSAKCKDIKRMEVAAIRKADGAEIRVAVSFYKGRRVVDMRVWYRPTGSVEYVPTRKGVTFDADKLPALAEAIAQATTIVLDG